MIQEMQSLDFLIWDISIFKSIARHIKKLNGYNQEESEKLAIEIYNGYMKKWYEKKYLLDTIYKLINV